MDKQIIKDLLKSLEPGQPFTIEQLVRTIGQNKGEKWAGAFEVQSQAEIELYLLEEGLIKECGTTKVYKIEKEL